MRILVVFLLLVSLTNLFAQQTLTLGSALYFSQSGNGADGLPAARLIENWGIRFNSPDSRWVFSSKPSVLIGYQPNGTDWGNDNLYVAGKIGIGTTSPRGIFDLKGSGDIYLTDDPNVGAGQSLFLPGHIYLSPHTSTNNISYVQARRLDNSGTTAIRFRTYDAGSLTESMHIEGNGNVGIGTTTPDSKLTVKGIIHTQEVKVDLNGSVAPDYVFEKDYPLTSLEELKSYIDENKHLPEIPSAKEMENEGINLKEMNLLLLKKVEELTLHVIEQKAEIKELQKIIKKK